MDETVAPDMVAFAGAMADAARALILRATGAPPRFEDKADASPVTAIDRAVERRLRAMVAQAYPSHGVIGEEFGAERPEAEYVWVIDPVDGTKAFILGVPVYGTLIALTRRGRAVFGLVDHPATGERLAGGRGCPATYGSVPARARACRSLERAVLCATTPEMFVGAAAASFAALVGRVRWPRYGTDCYGYGLLARGRVDLVVEADLKVYDYLAPVALIEAAGGACSDWQGRALTLGSGAAGVVCAGDARVHRAALEILSRAPA